MKGKKILVVEDDMVSQKLISGALKSAGYEVFVADEAVEAVQIARTEQPDLVTLDINLKISPDNAWDGFTVAGWLRHLTAAVGDKPRPAIIIVSGLHPDKVVEKASSIGAYSYLPKPFDRKKLLEVVAAALE